MIAESGMSVGVLVIGSLYWEPDVSPPTEKSRARKKWQTNRLNLKAMQNVSVPIRYGRRSSSRGCSYTMVISQILRKEQFGRGIVIPCKKRANGIDDLVEEAEHLWAAERGKEWTALGDNEKRISASWGCVGLLENPDGSMPKDLRKGWQKRVSGETCYGRLNSAAGEQVAVNQSGFVNIPWDWKLGNNLDIDVLLVTATSPTIVDGQYPSARDIADAWKTPEGKRYIDYFHRNRMHGINTFQDNEIEGLI